MGKQAFADRGQASRTAALTAGVLPTPPGPRKGPQVESWVVKDGQEDGECRRLMAET